jgi:FkbH-like protein
MNETNIARFSQLINKSNQFNLTTKRYSEDDLKKLERDGCRIYGLKISDKFGDLGISGIAIARINEDSADIDTLLMSCRALGRKIENEFLKAVLNDLQKNGVKHINSSYIPTKKNALVKDFYKQFGFKLTGNNCYSYEITEPIAMDDKYHMEEE